MHLVVLLLVFLVGWLAALRLNARYGLWDGRDGWGRPQGRPVEWWAVGVLALLASAVVLRELPFLLASNAVLHADAAAHAGIAQALARGGAPHGWIDAYNGGFPLGVNYPPLGWLLGAALIRLGLPTPTAIQALGLLPYVFAPVLVVLAARTAGARPLAALAGALVLAWISPYNAWLGTYENYLGLGVLSQAIAVPLVILGARSVMGGGGPWQPPLWGTLLASAHPQITVAAGLLSLPALLLCERRTRGRLLSALAAAGIAGAALYGPGVLALRVPVGWIPSSHQAWIIGYAPDRLYRWIVDGELFDLRRAPAITSIWVLATLVLVALARRRVPRIGLVTSLWSLALTMVGRALPLLGAVGEKLLSFLQPQRAFALVPLAMAAVVIVACEELLARGERLRFVRRAERVGGWVVSTFICGVLVAAGFVGAKRHAARLGDLVATERRWLAGEGDCGRTLAARDWVLGLERGRLSSVQETGKVLDECPAWLGVELASHVPIGLSFGAGGHVGVLAQAFFRVRPTDPGSAARAEALGIRYLLHRPEHRPVEDGKWRVRNESRGFELSERLGGTDLMGVGCVEEVWRGSYDALRRGLIADVDGEGETIADPMRLIAVEQTSGPLVREPVARGACDATKAVVSERRREPGAYEATVEAPSEVDVVVRATAFPTWVVRVDGEPTPARTIAPGFFSVRVPAGRHEIEAVFAPPRFYVAGLIAAGGLIAALALACVRRAGPAR